MVLQLSKNGTGSSAAGERILDDCKGSEFKFFDLGRTLSISSRWLGDVTRLESVDLVSWFRSGRSIRIEGVACDSSRKRSVHGS